MKDMNRVMQKVKVAVELIKQMTLQSIIKGIDVLIIAVTDILHIVKPCTSSYETLQKLIKAINNAEITVVMKKFKQNWFRYFGYVLTILNGLNEGKYKRAGFALGCFLRDLLNF
eukprot:TRINITY_DN13798_c0_g2_i1.p1 TRINITY_DN13798_c0_g2~~TRINITY_DN13798_c0_g2_i1.p1  ORF type:complete len:114 (+),score=17.37 TRINITY_DN13798_c0_g2_i1:39-380(+)